MKKYKYGIIGSFLFGKQASGGQSIKTINFADELETNAGKGTILRADTRGWKKHPFKLITKIMYSLRHCDEVVILPADRGVYVIPGLVLFLRGFRRNKLRYVVIGGWLPEFLRKTKWLRNIIKKYDGVYVETNTMKNALESLGLDNVYVMANFKKLVVLSESELVYPTDKPYKLCTFSRVMKEKGIETAMNVIKRVNDRLGYTAYTFDIYGRVDLAQTDWFDKLKDEFPDYVRYCGVIDAQKSVDVLQNYFALLFPTHYYTEGIPGTIIDAYAAGVPVISARWESCSDMVDEGVTGIGYDFDDEAQFEEILYNVAQNPQSLLDMKVNCINKAKEYTPESVIQVMIGNS